MKKPGHVLRSFRFDGMQPTFIRPRRNKGKQLGRMQLFTLARASTLVPKKAAGHELRNIDRKTYPAMNLYGLLNQVAHTSVDARVRVGRGCPRRWRAVQQGPKTRRGRTGILAGRPPNSFSRLVRRANAKVHCSTNEQRLVYWPDNRALLNKQEKHP